MKVSSLEREIRDFLLEEALAPRNIRTLEPDESLFKTGAIDSMVVMKAVAFCEENFGIEIPDEEIIPENFTSVRALARLIERTRRAKA
ncbi:MAG TPA: phosphopantetheine-binding protein [Candidatus Binataceae bacterium]|nr:phosphopantetheine-binding protein [Candidatus Binataceae bacterium]